MRCAHYRWAYGAVIFEILEGRAAFRGSSMEQLNIRIMRGSHEAFTKATPSGARALIKALLTIDVATRMKAGDALTHPWITRQQPQQPPPPAVTDVLAAATARLAEAEADADAE